MYGYLRQRIKHAVRFRHKRGYGVHSPFMFNLILNVIRDKERQFDYPETMEKNDRLKSGDRKLFRLLSRLIRYLDSAKVLCIGTKAPLFEEYLSRISTGIAIECNTRAKIADDVDFIYVGRDANLFLKEDFFFSVTQSDTKRKMKCIVITDIYRNGFSMQLWRHLKVKANVSVDMMWYGILFFDDRLQKGNYNLII